MAPLPNSELYVYIFFKNSQYTAHWKYKSFISLSDLPTVDILYYFFKCLVGLHFWKSRGISNQRSVIIENRSLLELDSNPVGDF